ncbi:MAG: hypothetical protein HKP09_03780 [Enterobacterales bacterium]|nr:hypothetical protein [Enterobacterales bacterium]
MSENKNLKHLVLALLNNHRQKAANSAYDKSVAIQAIATAGKLIDTFQWTESAHNDHTNLLQSLEALRENYYDSDGEYSSGKADIGSLIGDLIQLRNEIEDR